MKKTINAINITMFCQICNKNIKETSGMEHYKRNHSFDINQGRILKKGEKHRKNLIELNR